MYLSCLALAFRPQKRVFGHIRLYGQRSPRSDCALAQSDQGLHCPLTESLDTTECMNGEQRHGLYYAHAQDDLNMRFLRIFKGTSKLETV